MSDEPQALERSALERKDRNELITIATALGGKPSSRAKKADVVDLILELTGVAAADREDQEAAAEVAEAGAARARAGDREASRDEARAGDGKAGEARAGDREGGRGEARGARRGPSPSEQEAGEVERETAATRAAASSSAGEEDEAGSATAQEVPIETEPANRRRRRRGRDRDRSQADEIFQGEPSEVEGLLDLRDEGYGFLRVKGYLASKEDVYVSVKQTRQFSLRKGDHIEGASRPPTRAEKNPALLRIDNVNGLDLEAARQRPKFEELTPLFPDSKLHLESPGDPYNMTARIIDLIAPIGKGQRGLIVSPPKAGKTSIMKQIARSIETNHPEVHLIVLLVDERPEEVTDMRRWVQRGEVAAATFDRPAEEHIQIAELTIERAKRMVETGKDVVVMLDGITRLARAYNLASPGTGRIMSGGLDSAALYPPKRFFGAARNVEEGGSLTILATALVETGSKMDEVIFEEFKGTGNMELRLDRRLAERRIFPAIDVDASGTRHEELLFEPKQLQQVWKLRRVLSGMATESGHPGAGLELLIDRMKSFRSNEEFLAEIAKAPTGS